MNETRNRRSWFWLFIALIAVIFSIGVLIASTFVPEGIWKTLIESVGAVLLTSGVVTIVYEYFLRKSTIKDVIKWVRIKESLVQAGVIDYFSDFWAIEFGKFFAQAREVDIFLAYGKTWYNANSYHIRRLLRRPDSHIRVCFLNPSSKKSISAAANLFEKTTRELRKVINEVKDSYEKLIKRCKGKDHGSLQIYLGSVFVNQSFYRFDDKFVYVIHPLATGREERERTIPCVLVERRPGGLEEDPSIFTWVKSEFEAYLEKDAVCIFDSETESNS